jgi:archaellum biogenesis ATPase FlaH
LEELRKYLATQNLSKSSLIFIDSLSFLIDQLSLPSTSLLLNQLSELSAGVLALLGNDQGIEQEEWRRLQSISSTIFQLQLSDDGYEDDGKDAAFVLCKTMSRKKDETFETKVYFKPTC